MKKMIWLAISIACLLAAGVVVYSAMELKKMEISDIDLADVPDGEYEGKHEYMGFTCRVKVKVRGHRITDVEVEEDRDDEYVDKAKGMVDNMIREQSLDVDTVTGATFSSRAILKAAENALKRAKR